LLYVVNELYKFESAIVHDCGDIKWRVDANEEGLDRINPMSVLEINYFSKDKEVSFIGVF
jgi:hypothetical protein